MKEISQITVYPSKPHYTEINIPGHKHSATVIIAAAIAHPETITNLKNVPGILDVKQMVSIINELGGSATLNGSVLKIQSDGITTTTIPEKYSKHIHGALYFLPVILGRLKKIILGQCGGCQIGDASLIGNRPIQHMLSILEKFGAQFEISRGKIIGHTAGFKPCTIDIMDYSDKPGILTGPLVSGATKTAILAASLVDNGTTKIFNPYPKPDVTELLNFLSCQGYHVTTISNFIEITKPLCSKKYIDYSLISDLSEIMTYLSLSIYTRVPIKLNNITVDKINIGLKPELEYLEKMGIKLDCSNNSIFINHNREIIPTNIDVTSVGIYSDHHPFFTLMLTQANGPSKIREYVWKSRFKYALELKKLGFDLIVKNNTIRIKPSQPKHLHQFLSAPDLRAAAILIIAALKSPGETTIFGSEHLYRGYENFLDNLQKMGILIKETNFQEKQINTSNTIC